MLYLLLSTSQLCITSNPYEAYLTLWLEGEERTKARRCTAQVGWAECFHLFVYFSCCSVVTFWRAKLQHHLQHQLTKIILPFSFIFVLFLFLQNCQNCTSVNKKTNNNKKHRRHLQHLQKDSCCQTTATRNKNIYSGRKRGNNYLCVSLEMKQLNRLERLPPAPINQTHWN